MMIITEELKSSGGGVRVACSPTELKVPGFELLCKLYKIHECFYFCWDPAIRTKLVLLVSSGGREKEKKSEEQIVITHERLFCLPALHLHLHLRPG